MLIIDHKEAKSSLNLRRVTQLVGCGLTSGVLQAAVFNPWDRALYLSVKCERRFLDARNFFHPMAGVLQTISQRAISVGLYFPLEDIFSRVLSSHWTNSEHRIGLIFIAGTLGGAINGIIMNPLASIKVWHLASYY